MRTLETEIEEFRKEVESMRKELQIKEAALSWLEQRLSKETVSIRTGRVLEIEPDGVIDLSKFTITETSKRRTLVDEVKEVTKKLGEQEFTVAQVQAVMAELGIEFSAKNPRASLSVALGKLHDQGWVEVTAEGKGNIPNTYRVVQKHASQKEDAADLLG